MKGIIAKFDPGRQFGFIREHKTRRGDIFFHASDVRAGAAEVGAQACFDVEETKEGTRAVNITIRRPPVNSYLFFGGAAVFLSAVSALGALQLFPLLALYQHILMGINVSAFALVGFDKGIAGGDAMRVPEKLLLGIAAAGGSLGLLLGMTFFRHKTRTSSFMLAAGMIAAVQLVIVFRLLPALGR